MRWRGGRGEGGKGKRERVVLRGKGVVLSYTFYRHAHTQWHVQPGISSSGALTDNPPAAMTLAMSLFLSHEVAGLPVNPVSIVRNF